MKNLRLFVRVSGSLAVAVALLALSALLLALTTFLEVDYGTPVVQYFVYRSWWFYTLQFLLALNVLFSTFHRLPWKTRHLPFLCVHFGILVLLWGCFVTVREKQEAHLTIAEGKSARFAAAQGYHIALAPVLPGERDAPEKATPEERHEAMLAALFGESDEQYAESLEARRRDRVRVPFEGGPLDWRLYDRMNPGDIPTYRPAMSLFLKLKGREQGTIYGENEPATRGGIPENLRIETLDYLADSQNIPGSPLEMRVRWDGGDGPESQTETVRLTIVPQLGASRGLETGAEAYEIGLGAAHTMQNGNQLNFRVAESESETIAFVRAAPNHTTSGLGVLVLHHEGKSYDISVDDLVRKRVEYEPKINELSDRIENSRRAWLILAAQRERLQLAYSGPSDEREATDDADVPEHTFEEITAEIEKARQELFQAYRERRELVRQSRLPLGDTKYSIGSARFIPEGATISPPDAFHGTLHSDRSETEPDEHGIAEDGLGKNVPAATTGPMLSFAVYARDDSLREDSADYMIVFSSRPDMNTHANMFRVFGTYCVDAAVSTEKASGLLSKETLEHLAVPRLDILQSPKGRLHYRLWSRNAFLAKGEIAFGRAGKREQNEPTTIRGDSGKTITLSNVRFTPHDFPGYNIRSVPFQSNRRTEPRRMVKLRVSAGNQSEEFWLRSLYGAHNPLVGDWEDDQVRYFSHAGTPVRVTYENNELDLGFALYLRRFSETVEPGTRVAAQYSSLVDLRPAEEYADRMDLIRPGRETAMRPEEPPENVAKVPEVLKENVLIEMNRPGIFDSAFTDRRFRVYQADRRGPFGPQSPEFHFLYDKSVLPGETRPRDAISLSVLSVNDDPGRGWKYLGSAMLVFGTAWVFYGRDRSKTTAP